MQKFFLRVKLILSLCLTILVGLYIFAFPIIFVCTKKESPLQDIYGSDDNQIVLEMWHIEDFEGGSSSRKSYLEKIIRLFTKSHPGVYISLNSMSKEQAEINLSTKSPDLISFGKLSIDDKLCDLARVKGIDNFADSAENNGAIKSYPYMLGRYAIISREEITGDLPNEIKIVRKKTIYPFGYSTDVSGYEFLAEHGYTLPSNSKVYASQYELYNAFLSGEVTAILGSQRDVHRLKSREEKGTISPCSYIYLDGTTDLVQYVGAFKTSQFLDSAKKFCEFLLEESSQKLIADCGMFALTNDIYTDGYMYDWQKKINNTSLYKG